MVSLATKELIANEASKKLVSSMIEGVFTGLNYASNRLYLDKSSLMASMIKGIGSQLVSSKDNILKQAVIESFLNTASKHG